MRSRRAKLIALVALALGVIVGVFALRRSTPSVALKVQGYTEKRYPADIAQRLGKQAYVIATLELTNASKQSITYWARYESRFAEYQVLKRTLAGWKEPKGVFRCGTGLQQCTLMPSQAVTFDAAVDRETPCKVALNYSDGRTPSRFWQRLPQWLSQRPPWGKSYKTVTTEVIDLRNAAGLVTEAEGFSSAVEEDVPNVQTAAESGDSRAQFKLAGAYWSGTGVEKSVTEAMVWYEKAARKGHADAAYNLATIHEYGLAGTADMEKAIEWYRKAGEAGHTEARERLRYLAAK